MAFKHCSQTERGLLLLMGILSVGQVACGEPLAPQDYRGEVIFRAQGIVESSESSESWQHLRPALAYVTDAQLQLEDAITVRPLDEHSISGEFELELFGAPPDDVMTKFEDHPEWGGIAIALIVAVPEDHPKRLDHLHFTQFVSACTDAENCLCDVPEQQRLLDYADGAEPPVEYQEVLCCPEATSANEACELLSEEGESSLKDKPILPVDAVVPNFSLFYIEQAAPAGSPLAEYLFHSKTGLSAGYHLIEATPSSSPEADEPYDLAVVGSEHVALRFQRGVLPWGVNL